MTKKKKKCDNINSIKDEIKEVKKIYSIDKNKKELFDEKFEEPNTDIAQIIHDKLILMEDNDQEMKTVINKIYKKQFLIKTLLEYELLYYKPTTITDDVDKLIKKTQEILKKFQWKVGGTQIEDMDWVLMESDDTFIKIENCKVLMNTIETMYSKDSEFLLFMNNIVDYISRHTENISVSFKLKNAFDICFIFIVFQE